MKMKRKVCRKWKAPSRQAQVKEYRILHFMPPLLNSTVVFHRASALTLGSLVLRK